MIVGNYSSPFGYSGYGSLSLSFCYHPFCPQRKLVMFERMSRTVWSGNEVTQSGVELLWSRGELTTKVEEQSWSQLMRCASILSQKSDY